MLSKIPKSTKKILILDPISPNLDSSPPCLFLEVAKSFHSNSDSWDLPFPSLVSFTYPANAVLNLETARDIIQNFVDGKTNFNPPAPLPTIGNGVSASTSSNNNSAQIPCIQIHFMAHTILTRL